MAKAKATPKKAPAKAPAAAPAPAPAPAKATAEVESQKLNAGDQGNKVAIFSGTFETDVNLNADRFIEANEGVITVTNRALSGPGDGQHVTVTINYIGDAEQAA